MKEDLFGITFGKFGQIVQRRSESEGGEPKIHQRGV